MKVSEGTPKPRQLDFASSMRRLSTGGEEGQGRQGFVLQVFILVKNGSARCCNPYPLGGFREEFLAKTRRGFPVDQLINCYSNNFLDPSFFFLFSYRGKSKRSEIITLSRWNFF